MRGFLWFVIFGLLLLTLKVSAEPNSSWLNHINITSDGAIIGLPDHTIAGVQFVRGQFTDQSGFGTSVLSIFSARRIENPFGVGGVDLIVNSCPSVTPSPSSTSQIVSCFLAAPNISYDTLKYCASGYQGPVCTGASALDVTASTSASRTRQLKLLEPCSTSPCFHSYETLLPIEKIDYSQSNNVGGLTRTYDSFSTPWKVKYSQVSSGGGTGGGGTTEPFRNPILTGGPTALGLCLSTGTAYSISYDEHPYTATIGLVRQVTPTYIQFQSTINGGASQALLTTNTSVSDILWFSTSTTGEIEPMEYVFTSPFHTCGDGGGGLPL